MRTWVRYLIIGATALVANVLAGLVVLWITGSWPASGTTAPFLLAGYVVAASWYFAIVHPAWKARVAKLQADHAEETETAVENALEGMVPDRKVTPSSETGNKIVEVLANGLANVYGNEVNDTYREKAREIYPDMVNNVYDILLGEESAERHAQEESGGFIAGLEEERIAILKTYSERVRNDFPSLAKAEWEGLERVTDQIESEKERIRNLRRRRE